MKDRLYEAFDQIRAEEDQKEKTRAYVSGVIRAKERPTPKAVRLMPAMACLMLLLVGCGGYRLYMTPTSLVSIDVNPSVELSVNRFDRVVAFEGYNPDGDALVQALDVRFQACSQAVEQVLSSPAVTDCLEQGGMLSISVVGENQNQNERIYKQIESSTGGQYRMECYRANVREMELAHEAGLTYGKYRAWLELQSLDPEATLEQVREMTMRELREKITFLQIEQGLAEPNGDLWRPGKGMGHGKQTHKNKGNNG